MCVCFDGGGRSRADVLVSSYVVLHSQEARESNNGKWNWHTLLVSSVQATANFCGMWKGWEQRVTIALRFSGQSPLIHAISNGTVWPISAGVVVVVQWSVTLLSVINDHVALLFSVFAFGCKIVHNKFRKEIFRKVYLRTAKVVWWFGKFLHIDFSNPRYR